MANPRAAIVSKPLKGKEKVKEDEGELSSTDISIGYWLKSTLAICTYPGIAMDVDQERLDGPILPPSVPSAPSSQSGN